jgi:hypothetical protein
MRKRARTPVRTKKAWLNLGDNLPRDLRVLVYSLLSPDDMYMVRSAHGLASPPKGPSSSGRRYRIPSGFHERCAQRGHWNILKYTITKHDPGTLCVAVFEALLKTGQLPLIQWFLCMAHHHFSVDFIGSLALRHGQLPVLKWAVELGFTLNPVTCWSAVMRGKLDILEWIFVTKQCPWDGYNVNAALRNGHAHVIEWLDAHGFDYSSHYLRDADGKLQPVRVADSESEDE